MKTGEDKQAEYQARVVARMISVYCRAYHGRRDGLCPLCLELKEYAWKRLEKCPFGEEKPNCSSCTVHCYLPEMRERIKEVMRYAGPRMLFHYPWDAVVYLFRKRRKSAFLDRKGKNHSR